MGRGSEPAWGQEPAGAPGYGDEQGWGQDPPRNTLRPLNLGDVLDGMFRLAAQHWRAFVIGLGVVVVPLALLRSVVVTLTMGPTPGLLEILQNPEVAQQFAVDPSSSTIVASTVGSLVTLLAGLVLTPLIYGTAVHIAVVGYRTGNVDPMASLRAAAGRYWSLLGATVLLWLIPALIIVVPLVLLLVGIGISSQALTALGALGVIAALFVMLLVFIRIVFAVPAVMVERVGAVQALGRSNRLVKGKTGITFLSLLVIFIISGIITFIIGFPFGAIGVAVGNEAGAVVTAVGEMLTNLVTYTLMAGALVLLYFDRRVRSEGFDLTELADELGAGDGRT